MYFYDMKKLLITSILLFSSSQLRAQTAAIPDVYFEQALIDLGLDSILDSFVLTENINIVNTLDVYGKSISDLTDIQYFTALTQLNCSNNQLTSIDVAQNTGLAFLNCGDNGITSLDVSQNTGLAFLDCSNNQLSCLNIKNGPNTTIVDEKLLASNNPNLICIGVDDVAYSKSNWTLIDAGVSFSTDCSSCLD